MLRTRKHDQWLHHGIYLLGPVLDLQDVAFRISGIHKGYLPNFRDFPGDNLAKRRSSIFDDLA